MDNIFRLKGRSFGLLGSGELARVAEERLRANAEADGYEVHWLSQDSRTLVGVTDVIEFRDMVHRIANVVEERLRTSDGGAWEGPRSFYYIGHVNPFMRVQEYEEMVTVARLARYSGICLGVRLQPSDVEMWGGVPVWSGRIMSGSMMAWEKVATGELV